MSTSTRISSIQCEGNHGEVLKLTSKHTIQLPAGVTEAAPASKDERAASILPPPNALVSLTLQVRVDRKLVPVHDLQRSGLLETVIAFLTKYGTRLRIKAVLDPEVDQSLLEVPILLEPFPTPLTTNFGTSVSHLKNLAFTMHFYTSRTSKPSSHSLREELISNKLSPSLSSLVFRTALKLFSSLAARYPLVFDLRWLDYLQNQNAHLPSIAKSLSRLSQKVQMDSHHTILQQCLTRLRPRCTPTEHSSISKPPEVLASQIQTFSTPQEPPALTVHSPAVKNAFFSLLLHAAKRKHAVTKLVFPESQSATAFDRTPAETGPQQSQAFDYAPRDSQHSEMSEPTTIHEHAGTSATLSAPALDHIIHEDVLLASTAGEFFIAPDPSPNNHSSHSSLIAPILYSNCHYDDVFPWYSNPSPESGDFCSDMLDADDDLIVEATEWPETFDSAASGSNSSLKALTDTLSQLEAMTGRGIGSDISNEGWAGSRAFTKANIAWDYADMPIESPDDYSMEGPDIACDELQLDELDAKMSDLSEQADLDTVDRRMKALLDF